MKFNGYSFPHPVLGLNDDINGLAEVEPFTPDDKSDKDNYVLHIKYKLNNPDLETLLSEKKLDFICEINCSSTLFRRSDTSNGLTHEIKIPKNFVREKVELLFILVANTTFEYSNTGAHADFTGYKFDIEKGDVLAYLGETSFYAGISYAKLKAVSSFMEVIQGEKQSGEFNIILDNPKIQIQLSKDDYQLFSNPGIGKKAEYMSVFHSSFVLPSLIHALYQIRPGKNDVYGDKSWARLLDHRLNTDELLKGIVLEEENIPKIAQIFLGAPIERMLKDLYNQLKELGDDN